MYDGSYVTIKPKPMDRMAYIDSRRIWMYASYSLFMISLIPAFYTDGAFRNKLKLYNEKQLDYETAYKWQNAYNISRIVAVGCGVLWGYELVRYLIAANKVLPQNARTGKASEFVYYEPEKVSAETEAADQIENEQTEDDGEED